VAQPRNWHPDILAFIEVCDMEYISAPTIGQGEFERTPNPRGWAHINDAYCMTVPDTNEEGVIEEDSDGLYGMRKKMIAAAGGDDLCHNFHVFLDEKKKVDYDIKGIVTRVFKGEGDKAELPDAEDALWVIASLLAKSVNRTNYKRYRIYVDRMPEHLVSVFEHIITTKLGDEQWKKEWN